MIESVGWVEAKNYYIVYKTKEYIRCVLVGKYEVL